jgi:hypothetical protein
MPPVTLLSFVHTVRSMRQAQKDYYASGRPGGRSQIALRSARSLEVAVDRMLAGLPDDAELSAADRLIAPPAQPSFFDAPQLTETDEAVLDDLFKRLGEIDESGGL